MVALLIFISFCLTSTAHAEDLVLCGAAPAVCKCPSKKETAVPTKFRFDKLKVISCRPLITELTQTLNNTRAGLTTTTCIDPSPDTLYDQIVATFPVGCGHVWHKFNKEAFHETVATYVSDEKVLCDPKKYHSMCTSAVFLAFVKSLKNLRAKDLVTQAQFDSWSLVGGSAWIYLNAMARPDLLFELLKLGEGKTLRKDELPNAEWPKEGDFLQIWREDESGHATIFAGYLKDAKGKAKGICYWSSNEKTNGYGRRCEPLSVVNRLIVGRQYP